jgi:hypothetical protein
MMIGSGELAEDERVEAIRLATGRAKAWPSRGDLVGMQREHPQPGIEQALDENAVGTLDRDALHVQAHQSAAQCPQPSLVMRERRGQQRVARLVLDEDVVLLGRPVDPRAVSHRHLPSVRFASQRPDQEVPLRVLN